MEQYEKNIIDRYNVCIVQCEQRTAGTASRVQYLFYLAAKALFHAEKDNFQKKINLGIAFSKKVEYLNRKGRRPDIKVSRTRMFQKVILEHFFV